MRNAFVRLMTAKCDVGHFKPLKQIGLILAHKLFLVFAYIVNICDN